MSQAGFNDATGGGGGNIQTLTGNSGGAVPPSANNINILGASGQVTVTGNPGTSTLTIALAGGGTAIDSFQPDSGTNPVVPSSSGLVVMAGSGSITTVGGTNTLTTQLTGLTNHSLLVGAGTTTITNLGVATNGQIPIGSAAADPVLSTLTAGTNITITNGAGSISIASNVSSQVVAYTAVNHAASPYTVLSTDYYLSCDVTAGVITILLPNAPTTGRIFVVKDKVGLSQTSAITVTTVGGAVNIDGATTYVMSLVNYEAINLIFNGTSYEVF